MQLILQEENLSFRMSKINNSQLSKRNNTKGENKLRHKT